MASKDITFVPSFVKNFKSVQLNIDTYPQSAR
jgi:hypothetical protein